MPTSFFCLLLLLLVWHSISQVLIRFLHGRNAWPTTHIRALWVFFSHSEQFNAKKNITKSTFLSRTALTGLQNLLKMSKWVHSVLWHWSCIPKTSSPIVLNSLFESFIFCKPSKHRRKKVFVMKREDETTPRLPPRVGWLFFFFFCFFF